MSLICSRISPRYGLPLSLSRALTLILILILTLTHPLTLYGTFLFPRYLEQEHIRVEWGMRGME
jgi:hypothetical protein